MNYKKNVISVILWLLSAIMAGTGAMMVTMPSAPEESQWIGLVIAGVWLAVTGLVAFLLSRGLQKSREKKTNVDNRQTALVVEGILTVLLVAAGIVLRIREIQLMDLDVAAEDVWFDTVRVTTQTQIPQVVHGAVYLYLQILHGLLLLLGNKITVALGFQAGLQILGWILCYFAVRRLTGPAAAVTALGFGMLWPLCWKVVVLGPEELYQMLWMIGLCLVAAALNTFRRKGEQKGVRPILSFFIAGVAMGVLTYLDITGLLLYLPILSVFALETAEEETVGFLHRMWAALLAAFGGAVGFFVSIAVDACVSGKLMGNVLTAWGRLFQPSAFSWPVAIYDGTMTTGADTVVAGKILIFLLVTMQILGVFGFWCQKRRERQSIWILLWIVLELLMTFQITTPDIQGMWMHVRLRYLLIGAGVQSLIPYVTMMQEKERESTETVKRRSRLKVQDLETEEFPEEEPADFQEEPVETGKIQLIENPLPLPKKHVPKVLDYKLNGDDDSDFDYPVADDDDFDH